MGAADPRGLIAELSGRLSLSEYERDAYLAVLEHGSLTASDLADHADIPQPRIYDTVRSLAERDLVELHESRPMRVVAIDPAEALADVRGAVDDLLDRLEDTYARPEPTEEVVSLVTSGAAIRRNVRDLIAAAEYELSLALPPTLVADFEHELRQARGRNVSTELIIAPAPDVEDPSEYGDLATVVRGRRGQTTPIIGVADGHRSIYAVPARDGPDRARYGVLFNRSELGFLVNGFYGTVLWTTADPVFERSTPPTLPRRYASVRRCITEVGRIDGPLFVTIDGRRVETNDRCRIEGEIVDTVLEERRQVAAMIVETGGERIRVGGRLAAYEDVEAQTLAVGREAPPGDVSE